MAKVFCGNLLAKIFPKECKLTMTGLAGSGKTTLIYQLYLNEAVLPQETLTFNVESIQYKDVLLSIWDVSSQVREDAHAFQNHFPAEAIIYCVDSTNKSKLKDAADDFKDVIKLQLEKNQDKGCPVAIVLTKQDIEALERISIDDVKQEFCLDGQSWENNVFEVCSIDGNGCNDLIAWLGMEMKKTKDLEPSYKGFYDFFNIKPKKKKLRRPLAQTTEPVEQPVHVEVVPEVHVEPTH